MKAYIQRLGRALMLPVACLPAAALFLGIGYWIDPSGWGGSNVVAAYLCKTGGAILDNLGLLFAVGVAIGMARDKDGASALSALVGFLTVTTIMGSASMFLGFDATKVDTEHPAFAAGAIGNKNVFFGILVGCVAGALYNKFGKTKLPDFLAFFSGRRCVPILTAAVMSIISLLLLFIWPAVYGALVWFGESIMGLGAVGAGIYAFFNRLLIPTGLHHALNNVFWFNLANINDIGKFWGSADPASGAVIATGGSAVYSDEAMKHLASIGTVVYLKISYEQLVHRLSDLQERGVVLKGGIGMSLRELYDERKPLYERYAEITVNVDDLSITAAARKVADALR